MDTTKVASVSFELPSSFIIWGTPGAIIDDASGLHTGKRRSSENTMGGCIRQEREERYRGNHTPFPTI